MRALFYSMSVCYDRCFNLKTHHATSRWLANTLFYHYQKYQRDDLRERGWQRDTFQNCYIFVAPVFAPQMSRWSSRWCMDSHAIFAGACLIALAFVLVCFGLTPLITTIVVFNLFYLPVISLIVMGMK